MRTVLGKEFFDRPTLAVARDLVGKFLCRKIDGKTIALMIVETEAYDGPNDLACQARSGKTGRNWPMFGPPGYSYVYFTYGMHWMLNLVTGPEEYPAAVLIRGLEASQKASLKKVLGSASGLNQTFSQELFVPPLDGPAKLTKYLKIDKSLNAKKLTRSSGLWVEDRGVVIKQRDIKRTPRIGIAYAGSYAKKPWRFVMKRP